MKHFFITIIAVFLCVSSIYAQRTSTDLFTSNAQPERDLQEKFQTEVKDPVFLKINKSELSRLFSERNNSLEINVPVNLRNVNTNAVLELVKFDIVTPQTRIVKKTAMGEEDMPSLLNSILSYTGKVKGIENSFVTITFSEDKVVGMLISGNETYTIGTTDENNKSNVNYILFQESLRMKKRDFKCGSETMQIPDEIKKAMNQYKPKLTDATPTLLKAQVAIDVDFFTYNSYSGNMTTATAWALAQMSAVSATYVKEINCQLEISYLRIWTTPDPYNSTDGETMLDQFTADWNSTQQGVPRVIAHLLSRRSNVNVAGIAWLGVLCSQNLGYGLSATLTGASPNLPNYTYDVETTAHEIGHNFGSPHTHNCSWVGGPIDTCTDIEGGCYSGPLHPTVGTIMSYCDISGGTVVMNFGPQPGTLIRSRAENASCITVNTKPVLLVLPKGGETFRTGNTAAVWWGSSATGTVNIEYSTNNGANWATIQNNVPAQQRTLSWVIPYIGSTTQAKVRVYNTANPSEADTSAIPFRIILSLNSFSTKLPVQFAQLSVNPNAINSYQTFTWGSAGSHPSIRYNWKIKKTGQPDRLFQSGNGGTDSSITLRYSFLDSIRASFNSGDSVFTLWSVSAYNGIDSITSNSTILILKRTSVGITQISSVVPSEYSLFNNYPNPFNPVTNIKFDIPKSSFVKLYIYDSKGALINELVNTSLQAGSYSYSFDASSLSSGVYFYRVEAGNFTDTKRMILVK